MVPATEPSDIDAALPARAFKAGVAEHLADDEPPRLVGAHLAGERRQRGQQADRQCETTQHPRTPTDATDTTAHSGRFLGLTNYARLSSTNPERVYPILTTIRPRTLPSTRSPGPPQNVGKAYFAGHRGQFLAVQVGFQAFPGLPAALDRAHHRIRCRKGTPRAK